MGGQVDTLYIDILARVDSLERSLRDAERVAGQSGQRAGEQFGEGLRRNSEGKLIDAKGRFVKEGQEVGEAAGRAAGRSFGLHFSNEAKQSSERFLGILAGLGAAAGSAGIGLVKLAGNAEQAQTAFTTLLGSGEKAKTFLADLAQFAAHTPFDLVGLQDSAKKLLAFGFQAQQVIPMMTAIGDAVGALGGGKDVLDGVTLALGQMQAKGKVSAEEMQQLAERGIPAWQMLADRIGVSIPKAMKMAEQGAISSAQAIPAILQGMTDKFGGGMEAQSRTLLGMVSNTLDTMTQAGIAAGQAIVEALDLKSVLSGVNDVLGGLPDMLKKLDLKQWAKDNSTAIAAVGGAIVAMLVPALIAGASAAVAFIAPLLPFAAAGAGIVLVLKSMGVSLGDVRAGFEQAGRVLAPVRDTLLDLGRDLQARLMPVFGMLGDMAHAGFEMVQQVFQRVLLPIFEMLAPHVRPLLQAAGSAFMDFAAMVKDAFLFVQRTVQTVLIPVFEKIWPVIGPILGGILDGATVILNALGETFRRVGAVLRGDWATAFGDMQTTFEGFGDRLDQTAQNMAQKVIDTGKKLGTYIWEGLQGALDGLQALILDALANAIEALPQLLPAVLQPFAGQLAGTARRAADRNARDAVTHYNNAGNVYATPFGPQLGGQANTNIPEESGKFGFAFISSLASVFRNDPRVASDCAIIAYEILNKLGVKVKGSAVQNANVAVLEKNALASGFQKVDGQEIRPGDLVVWTSGNGKTYGVSSGKHAGVVTGFDGKGNLKIIENPGTQANGRDGITQVVSMYDRQNAVYYRAPTSPFAAPVTQQPKTNPGAATPSINSVFPGGGNAAPSAEDQKTYNLTLSDWNKLKEKALDLSRRLAKAEEDRNYTAQLQIQAEIRGWEGSNDARKGAIGFAQKIVAEQEKIKPVAGPITTAQITKAQQLVAALDAANKSHDPRKIDAAKTAMDSWSKASEGNARALSAVQSAQSGLNKTSGDYVATTRDFQRYGNQALQLIKAQEAAQKSGSAQQIAAADAAVRSFEGQGKAQASVLAAERSAYQSRQQLRQKNDADAKRAQDEAQRNAEAASRQADQLASRSAASATEAAQIRGRELRRSRDEAVKAAGDDLERVLAVQQAFGPRIEAAARAEAEATLSARKQGNTRWKEEQETQARSTIKDQGALAVRLNEIEDGWRTENSNAYRAYYAALGTAAGESASTIEAAAQRVADASSKQAQDTYAATRQWNLDTLGGRTDEGLLRLYDEASAQRDTELMEAVAAEIGRRVEALNARILESDQELSRQRIQLIHDEFTEGEEGAGSYADTLSMLTGILQEAIGQGIDPRQSGFVQLLDTYIQKGGEAAQAAQYVKDNLDQLLAAGGATDLGTIAFRGAQALIAANARNNAPLPVEGVTLEQSTANTLGGQLVSDVFQGSELEQLEAAIRASLSDTFSDIGAQGREDFWARFGELSSSTEFDAAVKGLSSPELYRFITLIGDAPEWADLKAKLEHQFASLVVLPAPDPSKLEQTLEGISGKIDEARKGLDAGTLSTEDYNAVVRDQQEALLALLVNLSKMGPEYADAAESVRLLLGATTAAIVPTQDLGETLGTLGDEKAVSVTAQLQKLVQGFQEGGVTSEEFRAEVLKMLPVLEKLALAAEAAGRPDLAEGYRAMAAELRGLGGSGLKAAENLEKLDKLKSKVAQVGEVVQQVFGLFGADNETMQGIGQLTSAATGAVEAFAKFSSGDFLGGISAALGAVMNLGQAIDNIDPGIRAWKKSLLEVAEAEKKVAQNGAGMFKNVYAEALRADAAAREKLAGSNFFTRLWWGLTGTGPQVMSDAAAKLQVSAAEIFGQVGETISSTLESSLMNAFEMGDWSGVEGAFEKSLNSLVARMALKAIIVSSGLEEKIKAYADARAKALEDGAISTSEQQFLDSLMADIRSGTKSIEEAWRATATQLPGYGQGAPEAPPTGSLAALQQEISDLQQKLSLATTDQERQRIRSEIEAKQAELDRLNGQVEQQKKAAQGSIAELQQQLSQLQDRYNNATTQAERDRLRGEIDALQTRIKVMQGEKSISLGTVDTSTIKFEMPASITASYNFDILGTLANSVTQLATAIPSWLTQMNTSGQAHLEAGARQLAAVDRLERLLSRKDLDWGGLR
ncbi:hypothetical protein DEIPH_ctg041orf0016 [Deinococcus phoenicis]|uniref:Tape measure protein N-terminal domain-containing protein n=1 Tax=Deinococcus phoenicis TaxID=1476583 RepID=A0A016QMW9_9DEIO|nr:hypothetical protein DEIPH_ctg041orf0016 [Deinococcus phoenicis]